MVLPAEIIEVVCRSVYMLGDKLFRSCLFKSRMFLKPSVLSVFCRTCIFFLSYRLLKS